MLGNSTTTKAAAGAYSTGMDPDERSEKRDKQQKNHKQQRQRPQGKPRGSFGTVHAQKRAAPDSLEEAPSGPNKRQRRAAGHEAAVAAGESTRGELAL